MNKEKIYIFHSNFGFYLQILRLLDDNFSAESVIQSRMLGPL